MALFKKEIAQNEIDEIEKLKEQIQVESSRIQKERSKIASRIEDLKKEGMKYLHTDPKSFRLEDIEGKAVNSMYETIVKKIELLEKALKQDNFIDDKFRQLAGEYVKQIEPKVKELQDSKNTLIEDSFKVIKEAEVRSEKLKKQAELITEEIDDLLEPIGGTVFGENSNYSGLYVINKIKNKLDKEM